MASFVDKILSRFSRENRDVGTAVQEESGALRLELQEEQEEVAVSKEVGVFRGGLLEEDALIRQIANLHNAKFTIVRGFMAASAMNSKLSSAKKRLFSNLVLGGKRIVATLRSKAAGAIVPTSSVRRDMQAWLQEQQKELQLLANETEIQIRENEQRLAEVSPILVQNTKIRDKLKEYNGILGSQNVQLGSIKGNMLRKIRAGRRELELASQGLKQELAALKEQEMAGAGR